MSSNLGAKIIRRLNRGIQYRLAARYKSIQRRLTAQHKNVQKYLAAQQKNIQRCLEPQHIGRYLDFAGQNVILLVGSGRSGTTWLSEILNWQKDHRFLFEPFAPRIALWPQTLRTRPYLSPDAHRPELERQARAILRGRVQTKWTERYSQSRPFRRRLIKSIRVHGMAAWLHGLEPDMPIVYIMRHPGAVAASLMKTDWAPDRFIPWDEVLSAELIHDHLQPIIKEIYSYTTVYEQVVVRWAIDNTVFRKQMAAIPHTTLFYETLCLTPLTILPNLFESLNLKQPTDWQPILHKPSYVTKLDRVNGTNPFAIDRWRREITNAQLASLLEILALFNLDKIYGESPLPLCELSSVKKLSFF